MKILHTVEFYAPSVGGMQEVVKQLSERLVALGHEVTVATTRLPGRTAGVIEGVRVEGFDISGNAVNTMHGELERYQDFLVSGGFDVVVNFAAQQWATDAALPVLDRIPGVKVFVPTGFSGLYNPAYKAYFAQMPAWLRAYDANVFLSDSYRDVDFARAHGVTNGLVIPNGAGADEFDAPVTHDLRAALGIPAEHRLILHVGSHTGVKGHAEAIAIFNRAALRDATLLIIANDLGGRCTRTCGRATRSFKLWPARWRDGKRLMVHALSRAETVAAYHAADAFLFPSNIECSPLVLFECMASRTPFLTTDVGNAAEIIRWSGAGALLPTVPRPHGFVAADVRASAAALAAFMADAPRRAAMADAGHRAWRARFTWEAIAAQYEALYSRLLAQPAPRG